MDAEQMAVITHWVCTEAMSTHSSLRILLVGTHIGLVDETDFYLTRAFRQLDVELRVFDILASSYVPFILRRLVPNKVKSRLSLRKHSAAIEAVDSKLKNKSFISVIRSFKPDAVISLRAERLGTESLREAKGSGAILINWTADDPRLFIPDELVPEYDAWCIFDRTFNKWFLERGAKHVEHLPLACDPDLHGPAQLAEREKLKWGSDLCFVGTYHPRREEFLEAVCDLGLAIWGPHWNEAKSVSLRNCIRSGTYIPRSDWLKAYASTKIILSIQATTEQNGLSNRIWETLAGGKCLVSEWVPDINQYFPSVVPTFRTPEQMRECCVELLSDDAERKELAQRGRELVLADHTYLHRARHFIRLIKDIKPHN